MAAPVHLLDVNVLCALMHEGHVHHRAVRKWFDRPGGQPWALCTLTETGFVHISTNPRNPALNLSFDDAAEMLASLERHPGYHFWPIADGWNVLTAPFAPRIFGYRQVTDAILLGLAIQRKGIVVTLDGGFRQLAGPEYERHVLLLQ